MCSCWLLLFWQMGCRSLGVCFCRIGFPALSTVTSSGQTAPRFLEARKRDAALCWPRVLLALRPSLSACHGQSVSLSASPRCVETYFRGFSNEGLESSLAAVHPSWI